jgi:TfoX/Sxy family transcriptional regulator of competence genes
LERYTNEEAMAANPKRNHCADLLEAVRHLLQEAHGVRERPMFGYPAFFAGTRMFACLYEDGLGLRLPAARVVALLESAGGQAFRPHGKPAMREWIHVVPGSGGPPERLRDLVIEAMELAHAHAAAVPSRSSRR